MVSGRKFFLVSTGLLGTELAPHAAIPDTNRHDASCGKLLNSGANQPFSAQELAQVNYPITTKALKAAIKMIQRLI